MKSTLEFVSSVFKLLQHTPSRFRAFCYRIVCPLYFESFGSGGRCHSGIKFGRPLSKVAIGRNAVLKHDIYFQTGKTSRIIIGDDVLINTGCHIVAADNIEIGDRTSIAEYVSIRDQHHRHVPNIGVRDTGFIHEPIKIGKAVWVGRGCYIGPGTIIGDNSIVGANSVVKGSFPPNVLIAGAPAVVKRVLGDNSNAN